MTLAEHRSTAAGPLRDNVDVRYRMHRSDHVQRAQEIIERRYQEPLLLPDIARAVGVSPRTLTRRFVAVTGMTPLRYQHGLRLESAEVLIAQGVSIEAAGRYVGFADGRMLRRLRNGTLRASA